MDLNAPTSSATVILEREEDLARALSRLEHDIERARKQVEMLGASKVAARLSDALEAVNEYR